MDEEEMLCLPVKNCNLNIFIFQSTYVNTQTVKKETHVLELLSFPTKTLIFEGGGGQEDSITEYSD